MSFDSGFELIPPDEERVIVLAFDEDIEGDEESSGPRPFGRGWIFDYEANQFHRAGTSPQPVSGLDQLRAWIEKALRTRRFAHPIYSDEFGIDFPDDLIGHPFSAGTAGRLVRSIEEALLVHDRIVKVDQVSFTGGPDSEQLYISMRVVTDEEELTVNEIPVGEVS